MSRPVLVAAAIVATVWWFDFDLALWLLVAFSFAWAVLTPPHAPRPRRPKQHHWGLGFGVGLTFAGIFPFVTIYRRRRY